MTSDPQNNSIDDSLRLLARSFSYPPTPDIAAAVRERLARESVAARPRYLVRQRLAWIALVLLALTLSLAVPEVQAFVRSVLRIGSIEIVVATPVPTHVTQVPATQTPILRWDPPIRGETTLAGAQATVPFTIEVPTYPLDLGLPDRVYAQDLEGPAVILGWSDTNQPGKVRLVLYELSSDAMGRKTVEDTKLLRTTSVNGRPALWVSGPHVLEMYGPDGRPGMEVRRLVEGNVLVWESKGVTYRVESALSLEEALRVAASLKPVDRKSLALTPTPTPVPLGVQELTGRTSLDAVQQDLGSRVLLPAYPQGLGKPDLVYEQRVLGRVTIMVWLEPGSTDRARFVLYRVSSNVFAQKTADDTTLVQETTVNGNRAAWVRGPHMLEFQGHNWHKEILPSRLVEGNVLVWEQDGLTYRLECSLSVEEAVKIAESLR